MDQIENLVVTEMKESKFIIPARLHYSQNKIQKTWDIVQVHESVAIIVFNVSRQVLVCIKQFRPAVYYNGLPRSLRRDTVDTVANPGSQGITLEVCAGIVDHEDMSLEEIARMELLEECGYDVPVSNLERVISYRAGIGIAGERQTLFYTEVTDSMKVPGGGGGNASEGELIEVVELTVPELRAFISQPEVVSPGEFLMSAYWFLLNKAPKH